MNGSCENLKHGLNLSGGEGDEVNPKDASATPSYSSLKICLWVPRIWGTAGLTV